MSWRLTIFLTSTLALTFLINKLLKEQSVKKNWSRRKYLSHLNLLMLQHSKVKDGDVHPSPEHRQEMTDLFTKFLICVKYSDAIMMFYSFWCEFKNKTQTWWILWRVLLPRPHLIGHKSSVSPVILQPEWNDWKTGDMML